MTATRFSSGDPAADRRADYAEQFAARGDIDAAIEVLAGALELAPGWAAGWYRLGEFHERAGQAAQAVAAWDRSMAIDPEDMCGASLKRDLARATPIADSMPPAFVERLFDQYAPRFEAALVDGLQYRGPQILLQRLQASGFVSAHRVLDLGCGTGLMGEAIRAFAGRLEGVDISARMLAGAQAKGVYDALHKRDIARMEVGGARYDLIIAADVFAYVGALEGVIGWCRAALDEGGLLAFTVEAGEADVTLRESRRFAHGRAYLADLLDRAGFAVTDIAACVVRQDRGADIASWCVVAALAAPRHSPEGDGEACLTV